MRSELTRPDLPDTPELFDRIEGNLRAEASRIRDFHIARRSRRRWFEHLRPVMTAGAAVAAMVILLPLTGGVATGPPPTAPAAVEAESSGVPTTPPVDLRLPSSYLDIDLIDGSAVQLQPVDRFDMIPDEDRRDMIDADVA